MGVEGLLECVVHQLGSSRRKREERLTVKVNPQLIEDIYFDDILMNVITKWLMCDKASEQASRFIVVPLPLEARPRPPGAHRTPGRPRGRSNRGDRRPARRGRPPGDQPRGGGRGRGRPTQPNHPAGVRGTRPEEGGRAARAARRQDTDKNRSRRDSFPRPYGLK